MCTEFYKNNRNYPAPLQAEVDQNLRQVEELMGKRFGDAKNPLLVSVRSGARASMPGMMDTILNLGLNDTTVQGIIAQSGDERFAYDAYRRFVQMYSDVVMGMDKDELEHLLEKKKEEKGIHLDTDLSAADWKELVAKFKAKVKETLGQEFPEDPQAQLWGAIGAVFGSWMNQRAITYRKLNRSRLNGGLPSMSSRWFSAIWAMTAPLVLPSLAIRQQARITSTASTLSMPKERTWWQVSVRHSRSTRPNGDSVLPSMEETMPECYRQLVEIRSILEKHYKDMQDIEFTIEKGKLYMLQTRNGKRTATAAIKVAVDMVNEGLIDEKTAVLRVAPSQLDQLLHPSLDPKAPKKLIAKGLPASPGAASGEVVFTADEAEAAARLGHKVILVRVETSPEDIHGMHAAQGILTARGGMTSHAAVVARGMGKCCVAGCGDIKVDYASGQFVANGGVIVKKGDVITLDGSTGEVMLGAVPTVSPEMTGDFATLMAWVDKFRRLKVRTNADTPKDSRVAREFGAEGIGLCRTEHMFFEADRIAAVREMILSEDVEGRLKALAKILPMQKGDFIGIFREMKGLPVTIRLLDPPLHEFLPQEDKDIVELAKTMKVTPKTLHHKVEFLHEFNPMLGHRGCRLGLTFPEIYDMQVQAIMEAACELVKNEGFQIVPEIMIPLVAVDKELKTLRENAVAVCEDVIGRYGVKIEYLIGTMIELPRAALTADAIAREAEFFSFGTNDLTQTTFGLSRDDAGKFLLSMWKVGCWRMTPS